MRKIWKRYRDTISQNCKDPTAEPFGVEYWRNELFITTVLIMIPLSLIAIVPGVYMALISEFHLLIAADVIAVIAIILIAFNSAIPLKVKKLMLFFSVYLVSIVLLYYLGSFGPGVLYLLATTILVTLILNFNYGMISVGLNTLICMIFGLLIYYDTGTGRLISDYDTDSWIAVSSNLIFLCAVYVLLIPRLFEGLDRAFQNQKNAESKLKLKQSEVRQSLLKLEEKNSELEEFAYTASHDLKEPLRMINSFIQLLQKRYGESLDDKANTYINFAVDGADRMKVLIDDLLEYSRIGRDEQEFKETDLNAIVHSILEAYRIKISEREARIVVDDLPAVYVIPVTIKLLFQNLIDNALKYCDMDNSPVVQISAEKKGEEWIFSVSDNGIGIEEIYQNQIFQLFKRLHGRDEFSGTGIGLAMCKKAVELHGGRIWVESTSGTGSTFYFTLPNS